MTIRIVLFLVKKLPHLAVFFFLPFILLMNACKDCRCDDHRTLRDSVALEYFKDKETQGYYHLGERDYRLFRGYYNNDTAFLRDYRKMQKESALLSFTAQNEAILFKPQDVGKMNADEVYQCLYWNLKSGKNVLISLVLVNKSDSITLSYMRYVQNGQQIEKVTEDHRILTLEEWYDYNDFVVHHEFFELTPAVHSGCGFDQESVSINWYERHGHQKHSVVRMDPQKWSLFDLFVFLLKKGNWYVAFEKEFIRNVKHN